MLVSPSIKMFHVVGWLPSEKISMFCQVLWVSPSIVRHNEGILKHLDDTVPNGDFPVG